MTEPYGDEYHASRIVLGHRVYEDAVMNLHRVAIEYARTHRGPHGQLERGVDFDYIAALSGGARRRLFAEMEPLCTLGEQSDAITAGEELIIALKAWPVDYAQIGRQRDNWSAEKVLQAAKQWVHQSHGEGAAASPESVGPVWIVLPTMRDLTEVCEMVSEDSAPFYKWRRALTSIFHEVP